MSPKRTRPVNLGTNPPAALVTYQAPQWSPALAEQTPRPILEQTFTLNAREAIADLALLSSGIIDCGPELARFLAPAMTEPGAAATWDPPFDFGKRILNFPAHTPSAVPSISARTTGSFSGACLEFSLAMHLQPSFECVYQLSRIRDTDSRGIANSILARPSSIAIHDGPSKRRNCPAS